MSFPVGAIFDLDGTILDSLGATFEAMREAVTPALGREPTDEELYARFGPADHEIVASFVQPGEAPAAVARLMAAYERKLERMPIFPGVQELLDLLVSRGVRLSLCTGRGRPSTDLLIRAFSLDRWFASSVTGDEVPRAKPAPDGVDEALRRLGLSAPEVLSVGDSVKDVEAALAAGTIAVAALWGSVEGEARGFRKAAFQARSPVELGYWLDTRG